MPIPGKRLRAFLDVDLQMPERRDRVRLTYIAKPIEENPP